jgi:hypothetical protein
MSFDKNSAFNPRDELKFDPLSPLEPIYDKGPHSALERTGITPPPTRPGIPPVRSGDRLISERDIDHWYRELDRVISAVRAEVDTSTPRAGLSPRIATTVDDYMMDLVDLRDAIYSHLKG